MDLLHLRFYLILCGYSAAGDSGEEMFHWNPVSSKTDNDGTINKVSTVVTGRWKRVYSGMLNIQWFGLNPSRL